MSKAITKYKSIERLLPAKIIFVVWDINKKRLFIPWGRSKCTLLNGIWTTEENAKCDVIRYKINNYEVLDVEITNIHNDLIRIYNTFPTEEIDNLIEMKLRQLLKVYVLNNEELKNKLKEKYRCMKR